MKKWSFCATSPNLGAYLLLIEIPTLRVINMGAPGKRRFQPGIYGYVGSAMRGLRQRVLRHLNGPNKIHWHIDRLTVQFPKKCVFLFPSYSKEECRIAEYFAKWQGTLRQIKDMGASDCSCNSHLFYFGEATIAEIEEHVDKFGENYQLIK